MRLAGIALAGVLLFAATPQPAYAGGRRIALDGRECCGSMAFSPDGRTMAVDTYVYGPKPESRVLLVEVASGEIRDTLEPSAHHARELAFSPDGRRLAMATDERPEIWDLTTSKRLSRLPSFGPWSISCVRFTPLGDFLLILIRDEATLVVWDCGQNKEHCRWKTAVDWRKRALHDVRVASDGLIGTLSVSSGVADWWDLKSMKRSDRSPRKVLHAGEPKALTVIGGTGALSRDGTLAAVQDEGTLGRVDLWALPEGVFFGRLNHPARVSDISFSPGGAYLVAGCANQQVYVWNLRTKERVAKGIQASKESPWQVAFGADEDTLVTENDWQDGPPELALWDLRRFTTWTPSSEPRFEAPPARPAAEADAAEDASLWDELAGEDAGRVYRAILGVADKNGPAVRTVMQRLRAAGKGADLTGTFEEAVRGLESPNFRTREEATRRLAAVSHVAVGLFRERLAGKVAPEVERRLRAVLAEPPPAFTREEVRLVRAVELLERCDTPETRDCVGELAAAPRLTFVREEARRSAARLQNRPARD